MMGRAIVVIVLCGAVSGCATWNRMVYHGPTKLRAARATVEAPAIVNVPPPVVPPPQPKRLLPDPVVPAPPSGAAVAEQARRASTVAATANDYINAVAVYDFLPGQVYHVYTSPDFVTTIALRRGEKLISQIAGDTTRWTIGNTTTGDDAAPTTIVAIKPIKAGLHTNLVLTTSQHAYFLDLESRRGNQYQNAISWNYPQDDMISTLASTGRANQQSQETPATGVAIEDLNYNYSIHMDAGPTPAWLPREVFDDGKKTFINFPDGLGATEAPPLFIRTGRNEADLVNYRVKGHFYIVDRLFDHAELRIGHDPQVIVLIDRKGSREARAEAGARR
jgi:type IV secretion system protein VirB9